MAIAPPTFDAAVNIAGTINVLEAAQACDARVTFASTAGRADGNSDGLAMPTPGISEARPLGVIDSGAARASPLPRASACPTCFPLAADNASRRDIVHRRSPLLGGGTARYRRERRSRHTAKDRAMHRPIHTTRRRNVLGQAWAEVIDPGNRLPGHGNLTRAGSGATDRTRVIG
jgi:hypothetical protein